MSKVWMRECYKGGVVKEENKLYEFHKTCDCDKCRFNFEHKIQVPNQSTVTTNDITKSDEIKKFLEKWSCDMKDGTSNVVHRHNSKIVYFNF